MNYNEHNQTNELLDSLASNSFIPLILQPIRITRHSNTVIDNIFSNVIDPDIISGNLTATISDHLPQFAIILNMFGNILGNKPNIYERDWSKFDRESFILDYFSVYWEDLLKIDKLNADNSTKMYLDKINMLLDTYAPLKRIFFFFFFFFFNWYSLHARLNSHYEAWSYKKRKHKKVKAYRKPI